MKGMYPDENVPFSLPIHKQVPDHERPTFYARYLTSRQQVQLSRLNHELHQKAAEAVGAASRSSFESEEVYLSGLPELILFQLTGWRHVNDAEGNPIPFGLEGIRQLIDMLQIDDGWALYAGAQRAIDLKRADLGKSESPASSAPASSAPAASPTPPAAAGTATTPPAS